MLQHYDEIGHLYDFYLATLQKRSIFSLKNGIDLQTIPIFVKNSYKT